jgi:hypothetical protein
MGGYQQLFNVRFLIDKDDQSSPRSGPHSQKGKNLTNMNELGVLRNTCFDIQAVPQVDLNYLTKNSSKLLELLSSAAAELIQKVRCA